MKRGHERERGSALDRRESRDTKHLWLHISGRVSLSCFFFSFKVHSDSSQTIPLPIYPVLLSFISRFHHSFHLSHQYKGMSRPVPYRNPSLHLHARVCVCLCVCLLPLPVFLNLIPCIFIAFVLADIFPLLCILRWLASFVHTQTHTHIHKHTLCFCSPVCVCV